MTMLSLISIFMLPVALQASSVRAQEIAPIKAESSLVIDGIEVRLAYIVHLVPEPGGTATERRVLARIAAPIATLLPALEKALDRRRPRDNCASFKPDNWVVDPVSLSIRVEGERLRARLAADVAMWQCFENPIGSPFKNKVDGNVNVDLLAKWATLNDSLALDITIGRVDVGGDLGKIAEAWAQAQGESIGEALQARLHKESMPDWPLPKALLALGAKLQRARFIERNGQPEAEFELRARLAPFDWLALQQQFGLTPGDAP
jgi:hypothetical protein